MGMLGSFGVEHALCGSAAACSSTAGGMTVTGEAGGADGPSTEGRTSDGGAATWW